MLAMPSTTPTPDRNRPYHPGAVRWRSIALAALLLGGAVAASAQSVRCHLTYAGANRSFTVPPAMCPDEVAPVLEGASFVFKVTNLAQPTRKAGVDIEVLTRDRQDQLQPTHKAHYKAWEAATSQPGVPHGFTGQQTVRGVGYTQGLSYWCERLLDKPAVLRPCGAAAKAKPPAPQHAEKDMGTVNGTAEIATPEAMPPASVPVPTPTQAEPTPPTGVPAAALPLQTLPPLVFLSPSGSVETPPAD